MTKRAALSAAVLAALVLVACGGNQPAEAPDDGLLPQGEAELRAPQATSARASELPEGWRRVQVREGFVGRGFENPLAGFTIDLPPGWRAGESWPSSNGPSGWIAGVPPEGEGNLPVLRFWMGSGPRYSADELEKNPRYDVRRLVIDGIPVLLHLARPDAIDQGPQVGIYYERIPGGPIGEKAPSLRMEGDSRGFTDQVLLGRVLTSARYAEIAELPGLPEAAIEPGADWQRVPARSDRPSFTIMLPPGWQTTAFRGIDSLVGRISGDGMTLTYDFGGFAGVPYGDGSEVRERGEGPPHLMWEEKIGDLLFWFVRPVSPQPDDHAVTGLFVDLEGNPPRTTISSIDTPRLSVAATGLSGPQQETVLAILRTIELERKSPTPPPPPR